jgi:hypothetical protein
MNKLILGLILTCLASRAFALEAGSLYGAWRLVSATSTVVATGEKSFIWGNDPKGFLTYTPDGRMSTIVTFGERPKPADFSKVTDQDRVQLYRTLLAYGGTFSIEGPVVTHHVDISSNETLNGTNQIRNVRMEGDLLVFTTPARPRTADGIVSIGEMKWVRVKPTPAIRQ